MKDLFNFDLKENKGEIDNTNINSIRVYLNDEQKKTFLDNKKNIFLKNGVDNLSDYLLKKIHEDINFEA